MKTIRVSAAIMHHDGMVYCTRRAYGSFKGYWEFPGGKREEGESGEEAIIREIKEELGADIKVESLLITVEYQYSEFYLIMDCYLCTLLSEKLTLSVHDDAAWLHLSDLDSVKWLPADVLAINKLKEISTSLI